MNGEPIAARARPIRTFNPAFIAPNDNWLQELVRLILFILLLDGGNRVFRCLTLTFDQTLDGDLDPLPSLVTIHGVIPADEGNELPDLLLLDEVEELLCVLGGRTGCGVATISEEMDVNVWNFELLRGLKKCEQVSDVGMDTSVGDLWAIP